jgi:hypothetical protein
LFILDWLQNVELRRRVHAGLNKGEARNALARSVFFYRLGEIRDRSFESQRYRASGLNLVTAGIVLWNTVYLERAVQAMHVRGMQPDAGLLPYLSPLGWEHINLTGDYVWRQSQKLQAAKIQATATTSRSLSRLLSELSPTRPHFTVSCVGHALRFRLFRQRLDFGVVAELNALYFPFSEATPQGHCCECPRGFFIVAIDHGDCAEFELLSGIDANVAEGSLHK